MKNDYYQTKESVEEYINLSQGVDGGALIEKLKNYLSSGKRLLEIGSGPGTDFKLLKKDYVVVGSDYSEAFLDRLMQTYKEDEFLNLDAATLDTDQKFDGIYSNKVLQHLTDEELAKSILKQWEILNPNGIVSHSFWKGEGSEVFKGMFVNYQTDNSLNAFFKHHFDLLLLEEYTEFETNDSLHVIAKKRRKVKS